MTLDPTAFPAAAHEALGDAPLKVALSRLKTNTEADASPASAVALKGYAMARALRSS